MAMGVPYDSYRGRDIAASLMAFINLAAWKASIEIGSTKETWTDFDERSAYRIEDIIKRHISDASSCESFPVEMAELADKIYELAGQWGWCPANAQVTLIAPTGTISFVLDADTTGCEPAYSLITEKELVQEDRKLVLPINAVQQGLVSLNYPDELNWDKLKEYIAKTGSVVGSDINQKDYPVFATANDPLGNTLSPEAHIEMLAALQPHISGAISKTVNLPNSASIKTFERLILKAWKKGVKGITFYRDGSKATQPLKVKEEHLCPYCGSPMIPTGSCWACNQCGEGVGSCSI
jgi:ribonucleoside-diphosphate reductase alpha chain